MKILVSTTKFGPDKNDMITQELVDSGKWKQALANVEKRLKKVRDDRLLVCLRDAV